MTDQPAAVDVYELTHRYPRAALDRPALDGVSLRVKPGEIVGVLGPNGGGKTTLFRILATMLRPISGSATIYGFDVIEQPGEVRAELGVVFQTPSLDLRLTASDNLMHHGRLYGMSRSQVRERSVQWLERFGLSEHARQRVERLSGGMRRRLELAKALLHEPRLLLMDEPATGLDPAARRELWNLLVNLRDEKHVTIAMTTHGIDDAERCDRVAILHEGKLIAYDSPDQLKSRIGGDVLTIESEADGSPAAQSLADAIAQRFGPWEGDGPQVIDGVIRVRRQRGAEAVTEIAAAFPDRVRSIAVRRPSLEDVFLKETGSPLWAEEQSPV